MSNDYPGDEPTQAHKPFENDPTQIERRYHDEDNATRLEQSIPAYDPAREPAGNPYPVVEKKDDPGIVAQLVAVGLICLLVGLGLGYFLFRGVDGGGRGDDTTTTTTEATTTTTEEPATTAAPTTTARPSSSTTAQPTTTVRPTTTARPTTSTTAGTTSSTAADTE